MTTIVRPIQEWSARLQQLRWAVRAVRKELLGFRFDYALEVVPTAGPRESPRYYVYSDQLFFDAMQMDSDGIPVHHARTFGQTYNPAYIAWYGLVSLERRTAEASIPREARHSGGKSIGWRNTQFGATRILQSGLCTQKWSKDGVYSDLRGSAPWFRAWPSASSSAVTG